jgi:hypothetical protein
MPRLTPSSSNEPRAVVVVIPFTVSVNVLVVGSHRVVWVVGGKFAAAIVPVKLEVGTVIVDGKDPGAKFAKGTVTPAGREPGASALKGIDPAVKQPIVLAQFHS